MNSGFYLALCAYAFWGLIPLYWKQLPPIGAFETLTMRILWGLPFVLLWVLGSGKWSELKNIFRSRKALGWLLITTLLISINWYTFVWAVFNNHLIESAMGYYINPLFNVFLGTVLLKEKLRNRQWIAVALACAGVLILGVGEWQRSFIALGLASTFALYGLCRKKAALSAQVGVSFELGALFFPALIGFFYLDSMGQTFFNHYSFGNQLNIAMAGPITIFPLVLFSFSVTKLKLSTMGIIQYVTPTLHFLIGHLIYGEPLDSHRVYAFAFIWPAVIIYLIDEISYQRTKRAAATSH
ncbi:MAG: EamA family transporter RarD [Bdellovibrio sp.]